MNPNETSKGMEFDKLYKLCLEYLEAKGMKVLSVKRRNDVWLETIDKEDGKRMLLFVKRGDLNLADLDTIPKDATARIVATGEVKVDDKISEYENIELLDHAEVIKTVQEMKLLSEEPLEKGLPSLGKVEGILKIANESFARKDYERALAFYSKILKMKSNIASVWAAKGETYRALEDYEAALECYKKALKLDVKNEKYWFKVGAALYALGRHKEEIECYDMAIKKNPSYLDAWNHKGIALYQLGKYENAILCYDVVLKSDPRNVLVWNNKGIALKKMDKFEEALKCFDEALEFRADFLDALVNKAMLLYEMKEYKTALEYFQKASELSENSNLKYHQGMALYRLEKYEQAKSALEKLATENAHAKRALKTIDKILAKKTIDEIEKKELEEHTYSHLRGFLLTKDAQPKKPRKPKKPRIDVTNFPCFGEYDYEDEGCRACEARPKCKKVIS